MQKILFLGNCQAQALAAIYKRHVAPETGDRAGFLDTLTPPSAAVRQMIEAADVVVEQEFDFKRPLQLEQFDFSGRIIRFPLVSGAFLWPFTGQPHPRNSGFYFLRDGPYPAEYSDQYLNHAVTDRVPADDAVARYLEFDVDRAARLDKRYELGLKQQRRRDAVTGINTADLIEARFQSRQLFVSPFHPGAELLRLLCGAILERVGVDGACIERVDRVLWRSPLDTTWLPIHPAVASYFGLRWMARDQRYASLDGSFTFGEWAERYVGFEWNELLAEGAYLAHGEKPATALEKLQMGLLRSPNSARGHGYLAQTLARLDRLDYAIAAAQRAIQLDPQAPELVEVLGHLLTRDGDLAGAAVAFRRALDMTPDDPELLMALSHTLNAQNQVTESVEVACKAIDLKPRHPDWVIHRGILYEHGGEVQKAEQEFRYSLELAIVCLVRTLVAQERGGEALAVARGALGLCPGSKAIAALVSSMELGNGGANAITYEPASVQPASNADAPQAGASADANSPELHEMRGHSLAKEGDFAAAAAAFRQALETRPDNADLLIALSHALYALARYDESIAAARRALAAGPVTPERVLHLGILHQRRGDLRDAEMTFRRAIDLDSGCIEGHLCLAHTLLAQHRRDEAILHIRDALARNPEDPSLANLLFALAPAESADVSPINGHASQDTAPMRGWVPSSGNPAAETTPAPLRPESLAAA